MEQKELIEKTIRHLKENQMDARFIPNREQLFDLLNEWVSQGDTVSFGGSMTLFETGVMDYLHQRESKGEILFLDRNREGLTLEQVQDIYRQAFCADVYFSSSNAITSDGYLYNVDGNGNRVAAMMYGPKSVIVIAGCNKVVETKEDAVRRMEQKVAPLNAKRLKMNTPCVRTGVCAHCMSPDRICCDYVWFGRQRIPNRIKVLILGEEFGY